MKTFTEEEKAEAISLLTSEEMARAAIEVPLQKMFDEFMTFVSLADFE
ncbi:hypothetical protein IKP85_05315 [bacterium]|nr:hypothetical protein [bacterium]